MKKRKERGRKEREGGVKRGGRDAVMEEGGRGEGTVWNDEKSSQLMLIVYY